MEWKKHKLMDIGTFSKGTGISKDEVKTQGFAAVRYGELYTKHNIRIKKINSYISKDSANNSKLIKHGDILFAGSGETIEDIGKSATYLSDEDCYAGGDLIIFSSNKNCEKYVAVFDQL